jgi:hypothetical protein
MIVGATDQIITVNVEKDITGYSTALIKYIKPNKTTGQFTATVTSATNGVLVYEIQNASDINLAGDWVFWAYITYQNEKIGIGEPFVVTAKNQGQL